MSPKVREEKEEIKKKSCAGIFLSVVLLKMPSPPPPLPHRALPGVRSLFTGSSLSRLQLSRLRPPGLRSPEERVREEPKGVGEEGDKEGVGVGVVGEEEEEEEEGVGVGEEDWLLGRDMEEARCSRRSR